MGLFCLSNGIAFIETEQAQYLASTGRLHLQIRAVELLFACYAQHLRLPKTALSKSCFREYKWMVITSVYKPSQVPNFLKLYVEE